VNRIAVCDTSATTIKQLHPSAGSTKISQQESAQLLYEYQTCRTSYSASLGTFYRELNSGRLRFFVNGRTTTTVPLLHLLPQQIASQPGPKIRVPDNLERRAKHRCQLHGSHSGTVAHHRKHTLRNRYRKVLRSPILHHRLWVRCEPPADVPCTRFCRT